MSEARTSLTNTPTIAASPAGVATTARVPRLSYFFPAHNEEANLEGLVAEALETLPSIAETFEIIAVDDGSKDATPSIADALAAAHPDVVRAVHHPVISATAPRSARGSRRPATNSSRSPTAIASSTWPTSAG